MQVFWKQPQATTALAVREVHEGLKKMGTRVAYTTVMTVMSRLADKKLLHRSLVGRGYLYTAQVDPKHAVFQATEQFMHSLQGEFGDAAIVHFAESLPQLDPKWVRELRKAFEE